MTTEDLINRNFTLEWAEQGDANAQYDLGEAYYHGRDNTFSYHPQDYTEAVRWYRKAAEQGLADAQHFLGEASKYSIGAEQDYTEAAHWYAKAAEQGHIEAQFELGLAYRDGKGIPQSNIEAYAWLNLAKIGDEAEATSLHHDWLSIAKAGEKKLLPPTNSAISSELDELHTNSPVLADSEVMMNIMGTAGS